ncbi:MAG TPA: helix-turn-helix transcriptional regulator [Pyrinomonadaceae bacterium]|nr:helix-turn-helix transcriptional regulator [Pyrinomonadaceae bacterium]
MRLKHEDWKRLFAAIGQLYTDIDPSTLGERAVATANQLMACDITAFDFFDTKGQTTGETWYDPPGSITDAEHEIFAHFAHEHPFAPDVFGNGRRGILETGDYLSPTGFRKTAIYNEYYRLYRIDHQMMAALSIGPNEILTYTYNRKKNAFTSEERLMIDLLAPHVGNAIVNSRKIQKLFAAEASLDSAMQAKSSGVVSLGVDSRIGYISGYARDLIEKYFDHRNFQGEYLPEELWTWVRQHDSVNDCVLTARSNKFIIERSDSTLTISLIPRGNVSEAILIFEETRKKSPLDLLHLGLTRRQTEVLFWISQGKTDNDIAFLLGISPKTVHKHAENIYVRLGVETRTGAMLRSLEIH